MDEIDAIRHRRKRAHAQLQALGSKVYEAFLKMEAAAVSARFALEVVERTFAGAME